MFGSRLLALRVPLGAFATLPPRAGTEQAAGIRRIGTLKTGARLILAIALLISSQAYAEPMVVATELVDLAKTPIRGLPRSFKVTYYRDASAGKQPLIVLVPTFGAPLNESVYRSQAQHFVASGYVVALPHLTGLYNDGTEVPVYDARLDADLVADTTPFAVEVLAMVAALSQQHGPASPSHVVLGQGLGSIIAARYAALNPPGCKALIMISAGFGAKRTTLSQVDDMRASEEAFRQLGGKVVVPSLWLHAKGNRRITDATANELFTAFQSGSTTARLEILPEIGMDGDALFTKEATEAAWAQPVGRFLDSLKLK